MFRLYFNIFWGKEQHYHHTPHESPWVMTIPLIFLAVASIFDGLVPFSEFISSDKIPFETEMHYSTAIASVGIGLFGILVAWILYKKVTLIPDRVSTSLGQVYKTVYNKFYIDEVYLFITKKIIFNCISQPVAWFDRHIVDGSMNGIAWVTSSVSQSIRGLQSGRLQQYAFVFITGVIGLVLFVVYWSQI